MATQNNSSASEQPFLSLSYDQSNTFQEHLCKARAIIELVGKQITSELGFDEGAPYSDSLWAASSSLNELADMFRLNKRASQA